MSEVFMRRGQLDAEDVKKLAEESDKLQDRAFEIWKLQKEREIAEIHASGGGKK